jgi:hypothetical protein
VKTTHFILKTAYEDELVRAEAHAQEESKYENCKSTTLLSTHALHIQEMLCRSRFKIGWSYQMELKITADT